MVVFYSLVGGIFFLLAVPIGFVARAIESGYLYGYYFMLDRETNKTLNEAEKDVMEEELKLYQDKLGTGDGMLGDTGEVPNMDTELR